MLLQALLRLLPQVLPPSSLLCSVLRSDLLRRRALLRLRRRAELLLRAGLLPPQVLPPSSLLPPAPLLPFGLLRSELLCC
jgi:hypothetical protein